MSILVRHSWRSCHMSSATRAKSASVVVFLPIILLDFFTFSMTSNALIRDVFEITRLHLQLLAFPDGVGTKIPGHSAVGW